MLLQKSTKKMEARVSLELVILKMASHLIDHKNQETHQMKKAQGGRFNVAVSVLGWLRTSAILFSFSVWWYFYCLCSKYFRYHGRRELIVTQRRPIVLHL